MTSLLQTSHCNQIVSKERTAESVHIVTHKILLPTTVGIVRPQTMRSPLANESKGPRHPTNPRKHAVGS